MNKESESESSALPCIRHGLSPVQKFHRSDFVLTGVRQWHDTVPVGFSCPGWSYRIA